MGPFRYISAFETVGPTFIFRLLKYRLRTLKTLAPIDAIVAISARLHHHGSVHACANGHQRQQGGQGGKHAKGRNIGQPGPSRRNIENRSRKWQRYPAQMDS
jgi:hypothetical protein